MPSVSAPQTTNIPLNPECINHLPKLKKEYTKNIILTVLAITAYAIVAIAAIVLTALFAPAGLTLSTAATSVITPFAFAFLFRKPFMNCIRLRAEINFEAKAIEKANLPPDAIWNSEETIRAMIRARQATLNDELNACRNLFEYAGKDKKNPKQVKFFKWPEIEAKKKHYSFEPQTPIIPPHAQAKLRKLYLRSTYLQLLSNSETPLTYPAFEKITKIHSDTYNLSRKNEMYTSCERTPFATMGGVTYTWNNEELVNFVEGIKSKTSILESVKQ